jgi:hypothetical protein
VVSRSLADGTVAFLARGQARDIMSHVKNKAENQFFPRERFSKT